MKPHLSILLLLCALIFGLHRCLAARPADLTGRATDERGDAVAFATVVLLRDGTQTAGTATDRDGRFALSAPEGEYTLSIQSLGYQPQQRTVRIASRPTDLGDIVLKAAATAIEGVVVQAQLVRREADRFVVDVANAPSAIGKNGVELLETAPGVWISDDKISIDGKSGTKVFVGDRELRMEPKQLLAYLRSLRASEILKIEVIPVSGADHDADSSGGILKITLRKRREKGMQGSLSFQTRQGREVASYFPSGNLAYHAGRVDLNLSAWAGPGRYLTRSDERTLYTAAEKRLTARSTMDHRNADGGATAGIVFEADDRNSFGAEFSFLLADDPGRDRAATELTGGPAADAATAIASRYDSYERANGYEASVNYIRRIDTLGSTFKVLGDYLRRTTRLGSDNASRIVPPAPAAPVDSLYRNEALSIYELTALTLALDKRFSPRWSLRAGAKYSCNRMRNDALYEYRRGDAWLRNDDQSFEMAYTEHIAALYAVASADLGRWKLTAGLRGEYTRTGGRDDTRQRYLSLFPNAGLSCDLSSDGRHALALRYARTIERPRFWCLTPRRMQISDYTYQVGNPALDPAFKDDLSLALTLCGKYTLTGGMLVQSGEINQTMRPDADDPDMLGVLWVNFDTTTSYYLSAYLPFQPARWWQLNAGMNYLRQGVRADSHAPVRYRNALSVHAATTFTLPAKCYVDLSYFYQSSMAFGNVLMEPMHRLDIGVKRRFGERLTLSASVRNVNDPVQTMKADGAGFVRTMKLRQNWCSRSWVIGITYDFKTGKNFRKKSVEAGAADEKGRM